MTAKWYEKTILIHPTRLVLSFDRRMHHGSNPDSYLLWEVIVEKSNCSINPSSSFTDSESTKAFKIREAFCLMYPMSNITGLALHRSPHRLSKRNPIKKLLANTGWLNTMHRSGSCIASWNPESYATKLDKNSDEFYAHCISKVTWNAGGNCVKTAPFFFLFRCCGTIWRAFLGCTVCYDVKDTSFI